VKYYVDVAADFHIEELGHLYGILKIELQPF